MTNDLDQTLREMAPEYRTVVNRLVAAYEPLSAESLRPASPARPGRIVGWSAAYLVAASLLVFAAIGMLFRPAAFLRGTGSAHPCPVPNEYRLAQMRSDAAVAEMIRTQNPDGSWKTDYLTRQNAAALKLCSGDAAQIAYRKAMRNLRVRQML